jgi:hypothetical protein
VRSRVRSLKKLASVYLVEEHGLERKHLRLLLSKEPGFRVAETEPQKLASSGTSIPDLFVLSHLHGASLLGCLKRIKSANKGAKTLLVGSHFRPSNLLIFLRTGVHGFVAPDNKNWTHTAVSTMDVDINSGLTGFVDSSGNPRIFYVGAPVGRVEYLLETSWNGGSWQTVQLYGGVEPGTALTGYLFNGNPSVYYIAVDGHVHEEFQVGSTWYNTDVTLASGAPVPISGSALVGYQFNSNGTVHFTTFTSTKSGGMDRRGTRTMSLP